MPRVQLGSQEAIIGLGKQSELQEQGVQGATRSGRGKAGEQREPPHVAEQGKPGEGAKEEKGPVSTEFFDFAGI